MEEHLESNLEKNSYFSGIIIETRAGGRDMHIITQSDLTFKSFLIKTSTSTFSVGYKVIVRYVDEDNNSKLLVEEMKKL